MFIHCTMVSREHLLLLSYPQLSKVIIFLLANYTKVKWSTRHFIFNYAFDFYYGYVNKESKLLKIFWDLSKFFSFIMTFEANLRRIHVVSFIKKHNLPWTILTLKDIFKLKKIIFHLFMFLNFFCVWKWKYHILVIYEYKNTNITSKKTFLFRKQTFYFLVLPGTYHANMNKDRLWSITLCCCCTPI